MSEDLSAAPESGLDTTSEAVEPATDIDGILEERRSAREEADTQAPIDTEEDAPQDEGAEEIAEDLDDQTSENDGEPQEVNPDEADETIEPETATDAPHFWSAEGKAKFATLDPDTQRFVLEQDKKAQAYVTRTQMDLSTKVETAMRDANKQTQAKLQQLESAIDTTRQRRVQDYAAMPDVQLALAQGQISNQDLVQYVNQELQAETAELARQEAEANEAFVAQRNIELQRMESPLLDPAKAGPFIEWAGGKGIEPDDIRLSEAAHLDIAYKAYLYEQGQAKFKAAPKKPKTPSKPLRPGNKGDGNPKTARLKALKAKADASGDMEDMLEYRKAKRMAGTA